MGNNSLGVVFPNYADYQPLGIVNGTDLPPNYSSEVGSIFNDNFESGDTAAWSSTTG
jgi:hypothetical protein